VERAPDGLVIERFVMADYEAVARLWERSGLWIRPSDTREEVELKLTRDPELFLVARLQGEMVGTAMGAWDGRRAYVYHLSVDPTHQRQGIASALLDRLEGGFRALGALKAKLQILQDNAGSQAFFAARGYELEKPCQPWGKELVPGGAPMDDAP
jgi:ribosomal protein S18 acetylase RimI-like enzyme